MPDLSHLSRTELQELERHDIRCRSERQNDDEYMSSMRAAMESFGIIVMGVVQI